MKEIGTHHQMGMNANSVACGVNMLADDAKAGPASVYFVVCFPWSMRGFCAQFRDADDRERGGPTVFYMARQHGWDSPYHWEVVMFDVITHEPLAKFVSRPTN